MTKRDALISRLLNKPSDLTWREAKSLLEGLGYTEIKSKGKTGGARVRFFHKEKNSSIHMHRPHSPSVLKKYLVTKLLKTLKETGLI